MLQTHSLGYYSKYRSMLKESWEYLAHSQLDVHGTQDHVACISSK